MKHKILFNVMSPSGKIGTGWHDYDTALNILKSTKYKGIYESLEHISFISKSTSGLLTDEQFYSLGQDK